jgi:hypothetical protein
LRKQIFISCLLLLTAMVINAQSQPTKTSAAKYLATAIEKQGLDSALQMFAKLRKNPQNFTFSAKEFNDLAYQFLDREEFETAVAIFKLNAEMFPDSWNPYFGLARGYMYANDKENAEKNLKIVLEKNPNHFIAKTILANLDDRLKRVAMERQDPYIPGQQTGLKGFYLGQKPPGLKAKIFAPGIVSTVFGQQIFCTFSPDGREFYFNHFMTFMVCRWERQGWTAPEPVDFSRKYRAHGPHITLDGEKFYFGWRRPAPAEFQKNSSDPRFNIYVCERNAEGWSVPKYVGPGAWVTSSRDGKLYTDDRTVHRTYIAQMILKKGIISKLMPLGGGFANLDDRFSRVSHPCISPDGKTMLFYVKKGFGPFAAYLDRSGVWSKPVNLSDHGFSATAGISTYSPDGKYVFFSDKGDIYWISSQFIEHLRPDKGKN